LKKGIHEKILDTHVKIIIIFMIVIISCPFFFMYFRCTQGFNQAWHIWFFFLQFMLAWLFSAGLFQTAMVIMTHVNW